VERVGASLRDAREARSGISERCLHAEGGGYGNGWPDRSVGLLVSSRSFRPTGSAAGGWQVVPRSSHVFCSHASPIDWHDVQDVERHLPILPMRAACAQCVRHVRDARSPCVPPCSHASAALVPPPLL